MMIITQDTFSDFKIEKTLGIVFGNTVRTRHAGSHFLAGLREIFGGEVSGYTLLLKEAREEAFSRLIDSAKKLGADGLVGVRFSTSSIASGASEILAV